MGWKADLHVHSKYSSTPTSWFLKKFGVAECFAEPKDVYKLLKKRGMNAFTLTDLDQIQGCLEILEYPNTFISCEVTAKFPEDDCKVHILTYNIKEEEFKEIMDVKNNIYELQKYLRKKNINHSVAHFLHAVNDKLTTEHFEKAVLLFNTFEINGCRNAAANDTLKFLLNSLTPEKINEYANKHNIQPVPEAWIKNFTAGSDDHTGIKAGKNYVQVNKVSNAGDFLRKIFTEREGQIFGQSAAPNDLAHNLYSIAYQYYMDKVDFEKYISWDNSVQIIDRLLLNKEREGNFFSKLFVNIRNTQIKKDIEEDSRTNSLKKILDKTILSKHEDILNDLNVDNMSRKWFEVANSVTNQGVSHLINYLVDTAKKGNVLDIFHTLGSVGSLYFMLSPYFISYSIFDRDKRFSQKLLNYCTDGEKTVKIGHFTDTYYDVNGVAKTLQQTLKMAKKLGKNLKIITCENTKSSKYQNLNGEKVFAPIGQCEIPEYPELKFNYPPFLEMLKYCYDEGFTHFHSATPGPVGLAALAISKILKKPIYGTYHTAFPQFMLQLTGDSGMEELAWTYMNWYYNQMDIVYVPSMAMGNELAEKGISKEKIMLYPRGVDIQRFRPMPKETTGTKKFIYVGRVSKEKNLHILASAFKKLSLKYPDVVLQIVGDGPYKEEMQDILNGYNAEFTGYRQGDDLVKLYSDADLFVFPSTTDTFGNVVLEAQACGTPVIVTDLGGPMENIVPNETGIIVKGADEQALYHGMKKLLDEDKLKQMSQKCREYMDNRSFENAFLKTWHLYETSV